MNARLMILTVLLVTIMAPSVADAMRVYNPSGNPPEEGWPILVYLKGRGVTKEQFESLIEVVNKDGISMVAMHAPNGRTRSSGNPQWTEVISPAHAVVQANLEILRKKGEHNMDQVFLAGYADGGVHAALAVMAFPESYLGALVASPVIAKVYPESWDGREYGNTMFLIHATDESAKDSVTLLKSAWGSGRGEMRTYTYPGARGENRHWREAVSQGVQWILHMSTRTPVNTR